MSWYHGRSSAGSASSILIQCTGCSMWVTDTSAARSSGILSQDAKVANASAYAFFALFMYVKRMLSNSFISFFGVRDMAQALDLLFSSCHSLERSLAWHRRTHATSAPHARVRPSIPGCTFIFCFVVGASKGQLSRKGNHLPLWHCQQCTYASTFLVDSAIKVQLPLLLVFRVLLIRILHCEKDVPVKELRLQRLILRQGKVGQVIFPGLPLHRFLCDEGDVVLRQQHLSFDTSAHHSWLLEEELNGVMPT